MSKSDTLPDKKITVSLKEAVAILGFVVTISVTIGGFVRTLSQLDKMQEKLDNARERLANIEGKLDGKK